MKFGLEKTFAGRKNVLMSVAAILILLMLLFPMYWMLNTSLKTEQEIFRIPPTIWPEIINTKSYSAQLDMGDFNMFRSFGNSFMIAIGAMAISVVLAVPAAYSIAKYCF